MKLLFTQQLFFIFYAMSNHSFSATGTYFVYASCANVSEPQQECIFALLEEWSHPFYCLPTSLSHVCTISIKDYRNILIGDLAFVEDNENAGFPTGHQVRLRQSIVQYFLGLLNGFDVKYLVLPAVLDYLQFGIQAIGVYNIH